MTTLRSRIFIIISLIVLIILAISIALVVMSKKKQAAAVVDTTPTTTAAQIDSTNFSAQITTPATVVPAGTAVKQPTTEETMKNAAKQLARIFVERYGSYSSDAAGDNIRSIEPLVTKDLWAVLSQRLNVKYNGDFIGVTTKVIAVNVTEFSSTKAIVEMNSQRSTTKGTTTTDSTQASTVKLIKSGDNWLVDDIKWGS